MKNQTSLSEKKYNDPEWSTDSAREKERKEWDEDLLEFREEMLD